MHEIRVQQATLEQQAKTEVDELNRKYLTEAGTTLNDQLCRWPQQASRVPVRADTPLDEPSDIDEILMEAATLMAVP